MLLLGGPGLSVAVTLNELLRPSTESQPARALNTPFMPSTANWTLIVYTVRINCTVSIGAGGSDVETGRVELRRDAINPPTTIRNTIRTSFSVDSAIANIINNVSEDKVLVDLVPPGEFVELVTVTEIGGPSYELRTANEREFTP